MPFLIILLVIIIGGIIINKLNDTSAEDAKEWKRRLDKFYKVMDDFLVEKNYEWNQNDRNRLFLRISRLPEFYLYIEKELLTVSNNNDFRHRRDSDQEKVDGWRSEFVEYIDNYLEKKKNEHITTQILIEETNKRLGVEDGVYHTLTTDVEKLLESRKNVVYLNTEAKKEVKVCG